MTVPSSEPVPGADPVEEAPGTGPTGHPAVDAALDELDQAADLPSGEQVAVYEAVHRTLSQTLATIDQS